MKIYHVTAFYKELHGGNKAGVVLFADALDDLKMQQIAARLGYSETAFVSKSSNADFKVRFFTPINEVDLCGHATIGTFNVMRDEGIISLGMYTQETRAGILKLDVREDTVYMEQLKPEYGKQILKTDIQCLFDHEIDFHQEYPIQVVSTGLKEIFLPLSSKRALDDLEPNIEKMREFCQNAGVIGVHAFCLDEENVDALSRNFAPVVGIDEESATGTSNGALACYIYRYHQQKEHYHMKQGYSMDQPSELFIKLDIENNLIHQVWVGGRAKILKIEE